MIKFEDVLSIGQQIGAGISLEFIRIEYDLEDRTFYAVFSSHTDLPVLVAITNTNTPIDTYIEKLEA